jgi:hypothetical protein
MTPTEATAGSLSQLMFGESACKSKWVWLLEQSEKSYFVLVPAKPCENVFELSLDYCRMIEVPKNLVGGLVHYNSLIDKDKPAGCVVDEPPAGY